MKMQTLNIPNDKEKEIQEIFFNSYEQEIIFFSEIASVYQDYLSALKNKHSSAKKLEYTIEHLLGYTLGLCFSSFSSLSQGYLNSSQMILRAAIENLVWAMYFYEFPEDIEFSTDILALKKKIGKLKNPKTNKKDYNPWIDGALDRINIEGKKLFVSDDWDWKHRIFDTICEEANHFVHTDFQIIEAFITKNENGKIYKVAGPVGYDNPMLAKNGIWKLIEVMLLSLIVFSKAFSDEVNVIEVTQRERDRIREIVKKLNIHKKRL